MFKNVALLLCLVVTQWPAKLQYLSDETTVLEKKISIVVYTSEILESVINRLEVSTGARFEFNTRMLAPYKAKANSYKEVSLKQILDQQLEGTTLKYKLKKGKLVFYLSP